MGWRTFAGRGGGGETAGRVPTLANVAYGAHAEQVLDFYRAEADQPTPVVFSSMAAAG